MKINRNDMPFCKMLLLSCLLLSYPFRSALYGQTFSSSERKQLIRMVHVSLDRACKQYQFLMQTVPDSCLPRTFDAVRNRLVTSDISWWTSGFFPGTLLYLYTYSHDSSFLRKARQKLNLLTPEENDRTTHDLGFMMGCSFGNAYRIFADNQDRNVLLQSARSLSTRFSKKVGCIRSWDTRSDEYWVIIDNMMNLELLCEATKLSGDSSFLKIAESHADRTMGNHFRADYSSFHVVVYNPTDGAVLRRITNQGAHDGSAWARGQAWGLYGFTSMYSYTKRDRYLKEAMHIADFIIQNTSVPADGVPYWDYSVAGNTSALRDASAAAVTASGLLNLASFCSVTDRTRFLRYAVRILKTLSSSVYLNALKENGGFILKHSVGNMPQHTEVDVPLTYADYYYVEALLHLDYLLKNTK